MPIELLRCLARAVMKNAPRALLSCLPFGEALYDIARDTIQAWKEARRSAVERRVELEQLANTRPDDARAQAEAVATETVHSPEERFALAGYLERLPGVVRRSLSRPEDMSGRTVPASLPLERAEDLVPFLPPRPPRFRPGDPLTGEKNRQWELIELVGNGGFGEVWRARESHSPEAAEVAVKVCLDPRSVATLRTEAVLLQRILSHGSTRGLVPLRQIHLLADPPFLVYDYIPGGDLTRLIRGWHPEGRRPARLNDEATRLIRYLATSLRAAHDLDPPVAHRDLKPSNILLRPTTPGRVKPCVADFGIGGVAAQQALIRLATTSQKEKLTTSLRGAHTPLYASPQQMAGAGPDPRDDVYALGVVWFQVLTGDTTVAPPTDWRDELSEWSVPTPVVDCIDRCLATDPTRRPDNAAALAALLEPLLRAT
jgi:serine/threonine protein kinase